MSASHLPLASLHRCRTSTYSKADLGARLALDGHAVLGQRRLADAMKLEDALLLCSAHAREEALMGETAVVMCAAEESYTLYRVGRRWGRAGLEEGGCGWTGAG